ncbi:hypothetical protein [Micromonospora sp. DT31]
MARPDRRVRRLRRLCVVAFVFVWRLLPETKGRPLAQIQQMWLDEANR